MTYTKTKCFVDCEDIKEDTAKFNFEDNTLKLGKVSLSNQQLKRISLMFATDLKNDYNLLNIHFQDESYSTIEARERLQNQGMKEEKIKTIIDMMSAVVILEDFINNLKKE